VSAAETDPVQTVEEKREAETLRAIQFLAPLADRWTFQVMREIFAGMHRYGELQRKLGISRNILAERLSMLVDAELLRRVRYRTEPDWYEYRLTERAADLYPSIVVFYQWVEDHFGEQRSVFEVRRHSCGLPSGPVLICSACGEPISIDPDEGMP
jgi:DNA-binding HxlR family transcriptional regulator